MKMKRPYLFTALFFAALALLLFVIGLFTGRYEICDPPRHYYYEDCPYHSLSYFIIWRVTTFLNAISGALTAIATVFIAGFTARLWISTNKQARLTRRAVKLARDEFRATHRPRIKIISVDSDIKDETIEITIYCVNAGDTPAVLQNLTWRIDISSKPVRTGELNKMPLSARNLAPGEIYQHTVKSVVDGESGNLAFYMALRGQRYFLFFCGRIGYDDPSGNGRATGCHRVYDPATEGWALVKDSDYEYSY